MNFIITLLVCIATIFSSPLTGGEVSGCKWLSTSELCGPFHPGVDYNILGIDDYGSEILASANGIVIFAGVGKWEWGNIILIEHTLIGNSKVWTQYAHLAEIRVKKGDRVERGQVIGTMGRGAGQIYDAHLHFEIRTCLLPADSWTQGMSKEEVLKCYQEPVKWIKDHTIIHRSIRSATYEEKQ